MQMTRLINLQLFVILVCSTLLINISCATRGSVSSLSSLGKNDVLIVGKVIVDPKIQSWEIDMPWTTFGYGKSKIALYCQNSLKPIESLEIDMKKRRDSIFADRDKTFFIRSTKEPFYILFSYIAMKIYDDGYTEYAYLPGGWKVDVTDSCKAIYIGTIKYTRDEFFRIIKTEVIDEYDVISEQYYKKFGNSVTLKKSLLSEIK